LILKTNTRFSLLAILIITSHIGNVSCVALQEPELYKSSFTKSKIGQLINRQFQLVNRQELVPIPDQDKLTILTLLSTECSPCSKVVKQLNQLQQEVDIPFNLYGMTAYSSDPLILKEVKMSYRPSFPIVSVNKGIRTKAVEQNLPFNDLATLPVTYLIDQKGRLIESFLGTIPLRYVILLIKSHSPKQVKLE